MNLSTPFALVTPGAVVADGAVLFIAGHNPAQRMATNAVLAFNLTVSSPSALASVTTSLSTSGVSFPSIELPQCSFDSVGFKVHCIGGYTERQVSFQIDERVLPPSLYTLDLNTMTWSLVNDSSLPAMGSQASVYMPDGHLYSFGGWNQESYWSGWQTDVATGKTTVISPNNRPSDRYFPCAVPINSTHIFLFGGEDAYAFTVGDSWVFDTQTFTWKNMTDIAYPNANTPLPRENHACAPSLDDPSTLYISGGYRKALNATDNSTYYIFMSDLWELRTSTWTWNKLSGSADYGFIDPDPLNPHARHSHVMVAFGDYVLVTGGYVVDQDADTTMYFYNLKTSKWEQKPTGNINLPSAFAYHALGTSSNGAGGSTTGGSNNSTKPATTSSSSGLSMPIITGIAAGVLLIIALVVGLFFVKRQRAKKAKEDEEHRKRAEALSETGVIVMDKYGYQQDDGAIALPSSAVTLPPPRYESNSTSSGDAGGAGGYRPAKATAPVGEPLFTAVFTTPYVKANPFGSPNSEGTLDRLAKPVKLSSLNFNPQQTVMDRFRIKGAPISSDAARFIVFDAEDLQSRQLVAVKMFSDRPETPGQASLAFRREVAMLRKLQSKSVVELKSFHILDVEEDQRPPYTVYITVMQRCSENLSQFIERNANLPDLLIRSIIRSLTEALAFLATEGVVHADIKPANVLLVDSVFVRLADFETARIANRETITAASFAYSAPEVIAAYIRNQEVLAQDPDAPAVALLATHAVDMWGLGCVVYEMYAKRPLTAGMTDAQTIAFLTDPRDTPIVDRIPAGVIENVQARHLLQSLLARNPGARKSARVVLGSAYLNAGMDTQQLATSFAGIQEQVRRVDSTVTAISQDTRALVGQQNEMRRMLIGLITEPNVPRMMALIPLGPPSWTQVDQWGSNLFRLHFLCEAKGNVHFTIDPGYPLSDPRKFVRNLGPYLRAGFQIASLVGGAGLSAIMGGGRGGGGAAGSPASNPFQTLGIRPTEYFTRMTQLIDDVTDQSKVQASGGRERPFAARIDARMARELEEFMKIVDPGRRCGGLQRCVDRDGSIVWLCEEHANGLRH